MNHPLLLNSRNTSSAPDRSLRGYNRFRFSTDVTAGLTVA